MHRQHHQLERQEDLDPSRLVAGWDPRRALDRIRGMRIACYLREREDTDCIDHSLAAEIGRIDWRIADAKVVGGSQPVVEAGCSCMLVVVVSIRTADLGRYVLDTVGGNRIPDGLGTGIAAIDHHDHSMEPAHDFQDSHMDWLCRATAVRRLLGNSLAG